MSVPHQSRKSSHEGPCWVLRAAVFLAVAGASAGATFVGIGAYGTIVAMAPVDGERPDLHGVVHSNLDRAGWLPERDLELAPQRLAQR